MDDMISFPPGVLGSEPTRLPLLVRHPDFFVFAKPAGVAVGEDALAPDAPDVIAAIRAALAAGKRQIVDLGIQHVGKIHNLDAEITGAVALALTEAAEIRLRNAAGSNRMEFVFDVLSEGGEGASEFTCDLPLARQGNFLRMMVSRQTGKKCATAFRPVQRLGKYTLWEARTRENRPHQVRIHAAEGGLRVPGETLYRRVRQVYLSDLKRGFRRGREAERPLHGAPGMHLRELLLPTSEGAPISVSMPRPRSFMAVLRRLEVAASGYSPRSAGRSRSV